MDIPLLGLLLVTCLAALFVARTFTKTAHVPADAYIRAEPLLSPHECALLATLERSLPDTYRIFSKLRLSDVVVPSEKQSPKEQQAARRHTDQFSLTFTLCSQPQMKVIAVVFCEELPGSGVDSAYVHNVLAANDIPVVNFKAKAEYYLFEVWVKLSEACPGIFEKPPSPTLPAPKPSLPAEQIAPVSPESPAATLTHPPQQAAAPRPAVAPTSPQPDTLSCSACNGAMVRRQVMKGPHSGKFFLVCSNFPTCRQMVALPDPAKPSAPAEQIPTSNTSASGKPSPPPTVQTISADAPPVITICSSPSADEQALLPPDNVATVTLVKPVATTKSTLLTAAVTAQPVSAMPAAVPTVEPQHDRICPACGKDMVKMQVAKGAHAGKFFWACSDYPTCRQLAAIKD